MDLQAEKQQIANIVASLTAQDYMQTHTRIYEGLQALARDMAGDLYTVVVVGEFKRGKSSLVNALLGTKILPMDVLPETATINAIMYDEKPRLSVMLRDGRERIGDVSLDFLRRYSAQSSQDEVENVNYIKIGYPCEMLKNRVVLVDTPGVSDLNEHRSEVTYNFLPKANAVLFVLDANSPLKKTEMDFIKERLIPLGITNILFVVNKYDAVDDEEEEDFLSQVQKRLQHAFQSDEKTASLKEIALLPFSAKWALAGQEKQDDKLLRLSGLQAVQEKLSVMLMSGHVEIGKVEGYRSRLSWLLSALGRELDGEYRMRSASAEELSSAVDVLEQLLAEKAGQSEKLAAYVEAAKSRIYAMADKSVQYFHGKMRENVVSLVEEYRNQDFKRFVETVIPQQIKRNIEGWLVTYVPHVDELLVVMEQELAQGLSRHFEQQVKLRAEKNGAMERAKLDLQLEAADLSQTGLQAGAITTAGAIAVTLAFSPLLVPLLTMWGRSKLFENLLAKKLEAAKAEVVPQLEGELSKAIMTLREQVHGYIDQRAMGILKNTEYAYAALLEDMRGRGEAQMEEKYQAESKIQAELAGLKKNMQEIQGYLEKLKVREAV